MNFRDLAKIDIKNLQRITADDIIAFIKSRLDIGIITGLIAVTAMSIIGLFGYSKTKSISLDSQIKSENELLPVAEQQKTLLSEIQKFKESFPNHLGTNTLIDQISSLALLHGVQINALSPSETKEDEFKSITTIQITIAGEDYDNIISFTKSIESLPHSITITQWWGSLLSSPQTNTNRRQSSRGGFLINEKTDDVISVKMTINSTLLKDHAKTEK